MFVTVGKKQNVKFHLLGVALTVVIVILMYASTASAAITGYVAKDSDGKYYEYDFDDLSWNHTLNSYWDLLRRCFRITVKRLCVLSLMIKAAMLILMTS